MEANISAPHPVRWGLQELPAGETLCFAFGPLLIWLQRRPSEIWMTHSHQGRLPRDYKPNSKPPPELQWSRWAFSKDDERILFTPCFPDRSVVVKPEFPFRLTVKSKALIYVHVPLWVRISTGGSNPAVLSEIPSAVLSNTWFGDFVGGELCYWLSSRATREYRLDPERTHMAICPIKLKNSALTELLVEKLRLQVSALTVYESGPQLWSNEVRIFYRGGGEPAQIDFAGAAPQEDARALCQPRIAARRSTSARTFGWLWDFTGLGI